MRLRARSSSDSSSSSQAWRRVLRVMMTSEGESSEIRKGRGQVGDGNMMVRMSNTEGIKVLG